MSYFITSFLILCSFCAGPGSVNASEPDWADYNHLLKAYVQPGHRHGIALNLVDYPALAADTRWPQLLTMLASFDDKQLASRQEKLAFWINAYNILAIDTVVRHWPVHSIRDAGHLFSPVWKQDAAIVAGQMRSLHEIEHRILRPMGEARIHFAIVCASVSCPDLQISAYDSLHLHAQLQAQAYAFVHHRDKGVRMQSNTLYVSKIFDWFANDFQTLGGIIPFIRQYRNDIPTDSTLSYLDYDWGLNAPAAQP